MNIAFILSHPSHVLAALPLAHSLSSRDDSIFFGGPKVGPDFEDLELIIHTQGFKFKMLDPYCRYEDGIQIEETRLEDRFINFLTNIAEPVLYQDFIETEVPDVILLDSFYTAIAIPFLYLGAKVILVSTIMNYEGDIYCPPLDSVYLPEFTIICKKYINQLWDVTMHENETRYGQYIGFLKEVAIEYKIDWKSLYYKNYSIVPVALRLPELIFWDQAFDFPRSKASLLHRTYLGNLIDLRRKENVPKHFKSLRLDNLILVSLGSKNHILMKSKSSFLETVLKVAGLMSDYLFVLVVHTEFIAEYDGIKPNNVILCEYCPQLYLLARAKAFITHAGGGAIKEAIYFEVPMICVPFDNDQFGNAARVVYHQLGILIEKNISVSDLSEKMGCCINDIAIKRNLSIFSDRAKYDLEHFSSVLDEYFIN